MSTDLLECSIEDNDLNPNQSTENTSNDENNDEMENFEEGFYFESDHLALKGNKDYLHLLKTLAILEAQRIKAIQDIDKLLLAQEEALQDPIRFVEKLQNGDLDMPVPQIIAEVPNIEWSQYSVTLPVEMTRPQTRKTSYRTSFGTSETFGRAEHEQFRDRSKIFVRGRMFDNSKPETFNQLWTTEEQRRLEELLIEFPPEEIETKRWKKIAAALGNRTAKQVCSRVQKYFIKLHKAGLPVPGRPPKSQPAEILKRSYHRHQKNNHFLFRHTTFFPSQDVPVYMTDFDDETPCSYTSSSTTDFECDDKEEKDEDLLDDDEEELTERLHNINEYRQLELLRRVQKEKEKEDGRPFVEHAGFKCDFCKEDPIIGSRWHCMDCGIDDSVDFCTDCVVTQLESTSPHPLSHRLVTVRGSEDEKKGVWDQDYLPHSFATSGEGYNYLDPNFMPA